MSPAKSAPFGLSAPPPFKTRVERLHIVAGEAALDLARGPKTLSYVNQARCSASTGTICPRLLLVSSRSGRSSGKLIEQLESEIVRLRTSGGGDATSDVDGVRVVVMEIDGDLKSMTTMLKELTLDASAPTLAVLGSRDGRWQIDDCCYRKHAGQ